MLVYQRIVIDGLLLTWHFDEVHSGKHGNGTHTYSL
jgi:hypothetical protein